MKKIVVTGMGAITPIGVGVNEYWENLLAGKSGISKITAFDPSELSVQFAGQIRNLDSSKYVPKQILRQTDPFMQYAYIASEEALNMSGLQVEPTRTGIVMGTALSGIATTAFTQEALSAVEHKKVGPRFIPKILGNVAATHIAIMHNIQGPALTVNTACSSGGDAIFTATMLLQAGKADAIIAVGAESVLCPLVIYALANAKALSRNNDNAETASRPFDATRDGFVIGEGGGALILETEEHALARGANIICEIKGCGNTGDAHHITAPHPEGDGAIRAMKLAIEEAGISQNEIGYINAHGTATHKGDIVEGIAINSVFGEHKPYVSSTKGATGHMMGAGGVTECITCIKTVTEGMIPHTLNLNQVDEEIDLNLVMSKPLETTVNYAMSNSLGFGGQNSSIIVGRYNG